MKLLPFIFVLQLLSFDIARAQLPSSSILEYSVTNKATPHNAPIKRIAKGYSLSGSLGLNVDDNKNATASLMGGLAGMLAGTLIGGSVGLEIGKGEQESLTGAFRGALLGAVIGNSLFIPLGVTVSSNTFKRLPLSIGLSAFAGMGLYFLAIKETPGAAILVPFSQLAISISIANKRR